MTNNDDTHVMAPRKPTPEMLKAGAYAYWNQTVHVDTITAIYTAMIEKVPK